MFTCFNVQKQIIFTLSVAAAPLFTLYSLSAVSLNVQYLRFKLKTNKN